MTKEEYVKSMISQSGLTVKAFAESVGLPYTTLLSMLSRGLNGASLSNVQKMCAGLSITVNDLLAVEDDTITTEPFVFSDFEKQIIEKYRETPEMHAAIGVLLGINKD